MPADEQEVIIKYLTNTLNELFPYDWYLDDGWFVITDSWRFYNNVNEKSVYFDYKDIDVHNHGAIVNFIMDVMNGLY